MIEKEISEIRRTLTYDKTTVTAVRGCYVNGNREIIAGFEQSFGRMTQEECEKYLSLFKRTLSGAPGKRVLDIAFSTAQVTDSEEHKLLMALKNSELKDTEALSAFYEKIVGSLAMPENYVILLAHNAYDIPYRATDGQKVEDANGVYSCIHCAVCPVKMTKSALTYDAGEKQFRSISAGFAISAPALGFLFPAFDGRQSNIYGALYFTGSDNELHEDFLNAVFHSEPPVTTGAQNQTFRTVLAESLDKSCSFGVVKQMYNQVCEKLEEHKASKTDEPLVLSKYQVKEILEDCGVSEDKLEMFAQSYDESFGKGVDLPPISIADPKQFELRTPDVVIKVAPGHNELIQTRVIDGTKYILIRADDGVELNGLNVTI